jgi:cell division protein FtsQ
MRAARERTGVIASGQDGNGADPTDPGDGAGPPPVGARRSLLGRRAFAVGLALTILAVAGWALLGPTVLVVRHVRVTGAGAQLQAAAVRDAADITLGTPLARLNPAAAARRVERLPAVLSARVSRSFPDTVVITVRRRIPALAVPTASGYALVDSHGVTVASAGAVPAGMPVLMSAPAVLPGSPVVRAAALVVQGLPGSLRAEVRSVSATAGSVTLQLVGGITVVWGGPGHGAQKAAELEVLLGTHVRYYDVSDPATAVTGS